MNEWEWEWGHWYSTYKIDEDTYTEEEQFADWVDKMIRAEEAEDG